MNKLLGMLQSRKFWVSMVTLLVSVGVLQLSDVQQADLVTAILTVVTGVGYIVSVALEDGLGRR